MDSGSNVICSPEIDGTALVLNFLDELGLIVADDGAAGGTYDGSNITLADLEGRRAEFKRNRRKQGDKTEFRETISSSSLGGYADRGM